MAEKDYDRAIEAYRFQVGRYHTWMNYYSLFHGALLVALYSVAKEGNTSFLFLIIAFLGYVAGLCWLGTVIGNRKWIDSWIQIVQAVEKLNMPKQDVSRDASQDTLRTAIYNLVYINGSTKGFLSTQKIMQLFTGFVTLAWLAVVLAYSIPGSPLLSGTYQGYRLLFLALAIIVFIAAVMMYHCQCSCICSNIDNMKKI